jgi:hypothetical protein
MKQWTWLSLLLCSACGGADQSNLFNDAGDQVDAGSQMDSAATDTGSQNDVTVPDSPATKDAVVDVPVGPGDSKIKCGPTLTCSAQTQLCCHHPQSLNNPYECVADISSCSGVTDVPIGCSDHENCVSQGVSSDVCCANTQNNGQCAVATDISCMSTCDPNAGQVQVGCSSTDPCPSTQTCKVSTCTLVGYPICL